MPKERIDKILVSRGIAETREKAKAYLMAGSIEVNKHIELKPGTLYDEESAEISMKANPVPYVSRGGLKLKAALDAGKTRLDGLVCADIGASTGGFTDVMLQSGASKVYAIDVGYGQLDYKLRCDERVVNMERTNVRYLKPSDLPEKVSFISIDVSFISLKLILPAVAGIAEEEATVVALVKPQFEAGRAEVGKGGIVRDPRVHAVVIERVKGYFEANGFAVLAIAESPITGAKGNKEFLLTAIKQRQNEPFVSEVRHE